jgi:hypothetical protein
MGTHPAVVATMLLVHPDDMKLVETVVEASVASLASDEESTAENLARSLADIAGMETDEIEMPCQLSKEDESRWRELFH